MWFGNSWRNRYWPIALDIGTDSIKMLQLQQSGHDLSVCASSRWRFPPAAQQDPQRRSEVAAGAIRDMLTKGTFHGRKVVTALASSDLSIKNVRIPHLPSGEMDQAVLWEASERFGFKIDSDRLKYLRAGEVRQGTETQDEIILLAITEQAIESHLALLSDSGLSPQGIEAEPVALYRVIQKFMRRRKDQDVVNVVLDIGTSSTRIVVGRGQQIVFIKCINIGGQHLTDAVAKQLNLSQEEAHELRTLLLNEHVKNKNTEIAQHFTTDGSQVSKSVSWTIHDAVRGEVEALAREVAMCLQYCSVTFRGLRSRSIVITGGQAYDPSVVKLLSEHLGVECVVGQPLRGVDVSSVSLGGNRRGLLAEWAVCAGLAFGQAESLSDELGAERDEHRLSA